MDKHQIDELTRLKERAHEIAVGNGGDLVSAYQRALAERTMFLAEGLELDVFEHELVDALRQAVRESGGPVPIKNLEGILGWEHTRIYRMLINLEERRQIKRLRPRGMWTVP